MNGHGSLNAFLFDRNLNVSALCACGSAREDWLHVLTECRMYDDLRHLSGCGVRMNADGSVNVPGVLECKEKYERFCAFARNVFERRRMTVRGV